MTAQMKLSYQLPVRMCWLLELPETEHRFFFSTELTSRSSSVDTWKIDAQIRSPQTSPEPKMVKNKRSFRALLHEFAEETSAHGVGKIASAESAFWRLFWTLVTLAGAGMVIYQGILLFNTYLDKPVKSDIDVTYSRVSCAVIVLVVVVCNCLICGCHMHIEAS